MKASNQPWALPLTYPVPKQSPKLPTNRLVPVYPAHQWELNEHQAHRPTACQWSLRSRNPLTFLLRQHTKTWVLPTTLVLILASTALKPSWPWTNWKLTVSINIKPTNRSDVSFAWSVSETLDNCYFTRSRTREKNTTDVCTVLRHSANPATGTTTWKYLTETPTRTNASRRTAGQCSARRSSYRDTTKRTTWCEQLGVERARWLSATTTCTSSISVPRRTGSWIAGRAGRSFTGWRMSYTTLSSVSMSTLLKWRARSVALHFPTPPSVLFTKRICVLVNRSYK